MTHEQQEILDTFRAMLEAATADGGRKRAAGTKVHWAIDPDHTRGMFSHLSKWVQGEEVDDCSGSHPLVHLAWRALALAFQENQARERRRNGENGMACVCQMYEPAYHCCEGRNLAQIALTTLTPQPPEAT